MQSAWRSALLCSAVAFHCPAAQSPSSSSNRPAEICWVVSASLWSIWWGGSGKVCGRGPSHCCANCNKQEFKAEGNTHTHTCTLTIHVHTHKPTVCKTIGKANRKHENCNNSNNPNYILIKPQTHLKTISKHKTCSRLGVPQPSARNPLLHGLPPNVFASTLAATAAAYKVLLL